MISAVTDADLKQSLIEVSQAIREACASTAKPTLAGIEYLEELRAEALALGHEVERRNRLREVHHHVSSPIPPCLRQTQ